MGTLRRWARGRNILLLLLLFVLVNLVLIPAYYPKFQTLDTLTSYTPEQAYQQISSYGDEGRHRYVAIELTLDLVYPLISALLFSLLIIDAFRHGFPNQPWLQTLALLPFLEMLADYLENACVMLMLLSYPTALPQVAKVSNVFTSIKFALTPLELVFVVGLIAWALRFLRRSRELRASHRA